MGARFWSYFVAYQKDIEFALHALREQEFRAGRYYQPPEVQPGLIGRMFGQQPCKPKPAKSIREAIKISGATGTRSILDMMRLSDSPDYHAVSLVPQDELRRLFQTDKPTRVMVEQCEELVEGVGSGQGICVVTYHQGKPDGIYFAGYSFD